MYQSKLLKKLRNQFGISQRELSELTGINQQAISNMERSVCSIPVKHFKKLASVFYVEKEVFLNAYLKDKTNGINKKID